MGLEIATELEVEVPRYGRDVAQVCPITPGTAKASSSVNSVPAAAVIRRGLALFGITGRKAYVGGLISWG